MLLRQYTHSPVSHGVETVLLILVKTPIKKFQRKKLTIVFQLRYPQKTVSCFGISTLEAETTFCLEKWAPVIVVMRRV